MTSQTGRAAIMTAPNTALQCVEYPLPALERGEVLVRITCCTICGSDLHSYLGRRSAPLPIILGHEIVGEIVWLGSRDLCDTRDRLLKTGDRITWTLTDSCGSCYFCSQKHLPMKCRRLKKYGHDSCEAPPHFTGGFADYCLVSPGTDIVRLPESLSNETAAPANCALATVMAGFEAGGIAPFENVLIFGAGALGVYAAALCSFAGCKRVIVADQSSRRLEGVKPFGATQTLNTAALDDSEFLNTIQELTEGFGVDCVLEVAGAPELITLGLQSLCIGGRLVEIGNSFPGADFSYDACDIVWRRLSLTGIHNYHPHHLQTGIDFLDRAGNRFPFQDIISHRVGLDAVQTGLELAQSESSIRVAVVP